MCMCDMTHAYVRHDSFICAKRRTHTCDMIHSHVCRDVFICGEEGGAVPAQQQIVSTALFHNLLLPHIHMCEMTHSYV